MPGSLDPSPDCVVDLRRLTTLASRWRARFETACATGRRSSPTAAWASCSPPRCRGLRAPEEANLRAPGGRRLRPRQLHQRGRGADRDEHVRREPPQARAALPRGRVRADQLDGGQARARRARDHGPRRVHRRLDRPGRRARRRSARSPSRRASSRAAAPTCSCSRRSTTCDELEDAVDGGALGLGPADRRADELRQRRGHAGRRDGARRGGAAARSSTSPRSARTTAAGRPRRSTALAEMARRRRGARRAAERRPRDDGGRARRLPARDAGVLRRVRRARARARRAADRRLLRHDAGADRRDPRGDRRGPRRRAPSRRAPARRASRRRSPTRSRPTLARLLAAGEFVVSVQLDPPLGGSAAGLVDAARTIARVRARALRRRERQPARARADERADRLGRDPARGGHRGRSRT